MNTGRQVRLLIVLLLIVVMVACSSNATETPPTATPPEVVSVAQKPTDPPPTATDEPTAVPTETETPEPTATETETPEPTATRTPRPTKTDEPPTEEPTAESTDVAAESATIEPTEEPTAEPTDAAAESATIEPTEEPTAESTEAAAGAAVTIEATAEATETTSVPTEEATVVEATESAATATITIEEAATDAPTATAEPTEASVPNANATDTPWPTNTPKVFLTNTPWPTNTPASAVSVQQTEQPQASSTSIASAPTPVPVVEAPVSSGRPGTNASPGAPQPYLSRYQMITFYGSPWGRALGILGNQPRLQTNKMLREHASWFQPLGNRYSMGTYHMVTTVANPNPPDYRHHVDFPTIDNWIAAANANEFGVLMDIQPGRVDVIEEVERIRYTLYNHHVHLAIDPEFLMTETQVPNVHIGQITAEQVNAIQAILNQIALEIGVRKVLMIHQFKDSMIVDKANIQNFPHVELLIDADGAFNADIKVQGYLQYANEPGFEFGGIKVFYEYDDRVLSPEEIMRINPQPAIVIYQ